MRVSDMSERRTISFEMFPPKKAENLPNFLEVANKMAEIGPDFMSVTYGAGGGTKDTTLALAKEISKKCSVVAHLNCDGLTNEKLDIYLKELKDNKVENILALRGDTFDSKDFANSVELTKAIYSRSDLCIGSACYPEMHPDSKGFISDGEFYRKKVQSGVKFFVTQMCFKPTIILNFLRFMEDEQVNVPIVVGMMPLLKKSSIQRVKDLGIWVPPFMCQSAEYESDEFFRRRGINDCAEQIRFLYDMGVKHIHLYTMNDYQATLEIVKKVKLEEPLWA